MSSTYGKNQANPQGGSIKRCPWCKTELTKETVTEDGKDILALSPVRERHFWLECECGDTVLWVDGIVITER